MNKLIHNRIKCNKCGDIIESKYTHDFVQCKCGKCFVDGGHEYMRVSGDYTDLSVWDEVPDTESDDDVDIGILADVQIDKLLSALSTEGNGITQSQIDSLLGGESLPQEPIEELLTGFKLPPQYVYLVIDNDINKIRAFKTEASAEICAEDKMLIKVEVEE